MRVDPEIVAEAPDDALSCVLDSVRLRSHFFGLVDAAGAWGFDVGARATAVFHVILSGQAWLVTSDGSHRLTEGDVALLPHGTPHRVVATPQAGAEPIERLMARRPGDRRHLSLGRGEPVARLLCGGFDVHDGPHNPVLRALPALVLVPAAQRCPWLETTLQFIAGEAASGRPGGRAVLLRLADILLIQSVRHHAQDAPQTTPSWMRGLRDPRIARALLEMHRRPGEAWTVATLARVAGLSRSGFALLFATLVGESPAAYLTSWRVHLAATMLRETRFSVGEIGGRLGYESEAAFSRAFRRLRGVAPGRFRQQAATLSLAG
jgi:AraC-like DNA-binding protein